MRVLLTCLLAGVLVLGCSEGVPTQAAEDEPAPDIAAKAPLYGTMDLTYNLMGPSIDVPDWLGTITIDDVDYGMVFFNVGSGKPFDDPFIGSVVKFGEIWVIYEEPVDFDPETGDYTLGTVLMQGTDTGVTVVPNSTYRMNGVVDEAHGPFAQWEGRRVHMMGDIVWQMTPMGPAPQYAPGVFRIN